MAAVVGHIFPVFYRFEGGKGVATALGMYFGLYWLLGACSVLVWMAVLRFKKFSSLSSLATVVFTPFIAITLLGSSLVFLPLMVIAVLIAYRHHENIQRLIAGTEPQTSLFK